MIPIPSVDLSFVYSTSEVNKMYFRNQIREFLENHDLSRYADEEFRVALIGLDAKIFPQNRESLGFDYLSENVLDMSSLSQIVDLLHILIYHNQVRLFKVFLADRRIDISEINDDEWTLLYTASDAGNVEIVQLLLKNPRVDVNQTTLNNWTPLHRACWRGHKKIIELLLNDPTIDVNKTNNRGWTALHISSILGNKEAVEMILSRFQSDVNKKDNGGHTPLQLACINEKKEIVELLLLMPEIDLGLCSGGISFFLLAEKKGWNHITDLLTECFGTNETLPVIGVKIKPVQSVFSYIKSKSEWDRHKSISEKIVRVYAAEIFSLTVLLSDRYLILREVLNVELNIDEVSVRRYFKIAQKLPLELQMVLANRTYDSSKNIIYVKNSEKSFKNIFKSFAVS